MFSYCRNMHGPFIFKKPDDFKMEMGNMHINTGKSGFVRVGVLPDPATNSVWSPEVGHPNMQFHIWAFNVAGTLNSPFINSNFVIEPELNGQLRLRYTGTSNPGVDFVIIAYTG